MAKNKNNTEPDFRLNPDNIKVNDWVFRNGDIGFVEGVSVDTENMLQFWVRWNNDSTPEPELAEHLQKLNRPVEVGGINYTIDLDLLVLSPELQQRVKLDDSVVDEYSEAFKNHVKFPPITIWYRTDEEYKGDPLLKPAYLIDGFHRAKAAKMAGIKELPFIRKQGTLREALLYSTSINSTHGLRRSNQDKRKSVMTLLEDEEWNGWSNVAIAKQCNVSESLVRKLRKENEYEGNLTSFKRGGNQDSEEEATRTYITKDGVKAKMRVGNLGKGKLENLDPDLSDSGFLSEDNYPEDNHFYPEDVIKNLDDDLADEDEDYSGNEDSVTSNEDNEDNEQLHSYESDNGAKPKNPTLPLRPKRSKKKPRLVNPLSVGDKVKVKDNHYFGGKTGVVTQIPNLHSVIVAFEDNHPQLLQLSDLDLPESLQKPKLEKPQRPQKKEIYIQEGCNYYAGIGNRLKWYIEASEEDYRLFQEYQEEISAPSLSSAFKRSIAINKESNQIYTDDVVVNLSSKMTYLNEEQRLFLAKQLLESDPDIFSKVIKENSLK